MSFVEELTWRGLLHQVSDATLAEKMRSEPLTLYAGFDPSAESLHVGSLLPILALMRAQKAGHRPIALLGGATGMIGDPSGKSEERRLLLPEEVQRNVAGIRKQLERFLDFSAEGALLANNYDWFANFNYLDFLREIGKHFSVNMMLAKESVRARLEDREHGISYTEFSYMLIQAYDFLWLHDHYNCCLQVGGSDQWGNITAGIDLVRRLRQKSAYGLTQPLVANASGQKFGKTEKGAIWLDAERTSPYEFYQFFLRTDDRDVGRFLRFYTFLSQPEIEDLEERTRVDPSKREAHRVLAREVTNMVHGEKATAEAEEAAQALFRGRAADITMLSGAPTTELTVSVLDGMGLTELLVRTGLCNSKSAARREIEAGGIYLNETRVANWEQVVAPVDWEKQSKLILRRGKKTYHIVNVLS